MPGLVNTLMLLSEEANPHRRNTLCEWMTVNHSSPDLLPDPLSAFSAADIGVGKTTNGVPLGSLQYYNEPQNPIPIIKAPRLSC